MSSLLVRPAGRIAWAFGRNASAAMLVLAAGLPVVAAAWVLLTPKAVAAGVAIVAAAIFATAGSSRGDGCRWCPRSAGAAAGQCRRPAERLFLRHGLQPLRLERLALLALILFRPARGPRR